jgi:serine/threonine protein kinase
VVKLGDFGLARDLKDEASKLLSRPGAGAANHKSRFAENRHVHTEGVGTGVYASPEQLEGGICTDKSDMFSFGVMMVELFQVSTRPRTLNH